MSTAVAGKPIEFERAREIVLERVTPLAAEPVPLREALGRHLVEDAVAAEAVPAIDNSAMGGFAVRAEDTSTARPETPVSLLVAAESRAGHPASPRRCAEPPATTLRTGCSLALRSASAARP